MVFMSKRNSYNGKQNEYINKLTDQIIGRGQSQMDHQSESMSAAGPQETTKSQFTDDETITKLLGNKQKLFQFREMVIMHIKKNDISTKIISSDFEKLSNDIILPLGSFKQCLNVLGITLKPQVSIFFQSLLTIFKIAIRPICSEGGDQPQK